MEVEREGGRRKEGGREVIECFSLLIWVFSTYKY